MSWAEIKKSINSDFMISSLKSQIVSPDNGYYPSQQTSIMNAFLEEFNAVKIGYYHDFYLIKDDVDSGTFDKVKALCEAYYHIVNMWSISQGYGIIAKYSRMVNMDDVSPNSGGAQYLTNNTWINCITENGIRYYTNGTSANYDNAEGNHFGHAVIRLY